MASAFGPELPPELKQDEKKEEPKPKEDPGPALMWDESTEIDPDNPDYAAMMALKEDLTPDEQAEALKVRISWGTCSAPVPHGGCGGSRLRRFWQRCARGYVLQKRLGISPRLNVRGTSLWRLNRSKGTSA